eukprot:c34843_g1_i1 orf=158-565(+)
MLALTPLRSPVRLVSVSICLLHGGHDLPQKIHAEEEQTPVSSGDFFWVRALCHQGQLNQAVSMLSAMNTPPSPEICLFLLKACNHKKALSQAQRVHAHLARHHISLSGFLGDYLVMTLARCGAVEDALELFLGLP